MSSTPYSPLIDKDTDEDANQRDNSERKKSTLESVLSKTGYPISVWYILGNEFCERFSYYGMHAILVIYLTHMLKMDDDSATAVYHAFNMLCYFSPLLGAILADSWLGKYRTILYVSMIYAFGNIVVAITSIPAILAKVKLTGVMIGLLLIAIGTGGIKPCVSAFGGDQFSAAQENLLQSFFSIFYFAINLGSLLSMIVTPILRGDVNCFGNNCYPLAFGVPAILMITSVGLFWCGRKKYKKIPPEGNVVLQVTCAVGCAIKNRFRNKDPSVKKDHWMDWAENDYGAKMISDIKALFKVLFMFLPMPVFWTLFDQQGSRWTLQAEEMDGDLGAFGTLKPDQVQAMNPVFILILIPLFEYAIYPLLSKCNLLVKPLQRMCAGMLLAAISFVFAAFLHIAIQKSRLHVVEPPNGFANLRVINAAPCPLKVSGFGFDTSLAVDKASVYAHVPITLTNLKVESQNCSVAVPEKNFLLKISEHEVNTFVIGTKNKELVGLKLKDLSAPLKAGVIKARFVYLGGNITDKVDIKLNKTLTFSGVTDLMSDTNYTRILSDHYNIRVKKFNTSQELFKKQVYFGNGGVFTVVIREDPDKPGELEMIRYTDVRPMSISMLWQLPQYIVLTSGEVLFSITGLEFAYSQSPVSMKSCIMAAWLLTVSIGNAIVVVFAEARITNNMATEFFFFAGLLAVVMLIFMFMSYYYKYASYSANGDVKTEDHIPLQDAGDMGAESDK
ncbi:peptide transporter family 1 [Nematostella vectensis]|uniref:peptide transporter family 1 n=1 Tax=Nematostella vectensis TaxID=45351 RepID=UPI00138FD64D|nr:peptide transporter family 1 [Nematostella vectensis]